MNLFSHSFIHFQQSLLSELAELFHNSYEIISLSTNNVSQLLLGYDPSGTKKQ